VVNTLVRYLKRGRVEIRAGVTVLQIEASDERIKSVRTNIGNFSGTNYILATGGVSHPETGSTGDGFTWLAELGHTIASPRATIVPLRVKEGWPKQLSGISLPHMKITFFSHGVKKFSRTGPLLFTHFGISGPTILNSSGKVADLLEEGSVRAYIDLFPELDQGALDQKIRDIFDAHKNKQLKSVMKDVVPPGTAEVLLSLLKDIDSEIKVHSVTKEARHELALFLKHIPLIVNGLMGLDRAVVADGGLPLTEIDMRTMRSTRYRNLFVTGDLLHIERPSGGYSLQLCWTTGYVAGTHAS